MRLVRILVVVLAAGTVGCKPKGPSPEYLAACEGPPLRNVEERQAAMEDGAEIIPGFECISKRSYPAVMESRAARAAGDGGLKERARGTAGPRPKDQALGEARKGFTTKFSDPAPGTPPLPNPPANLFVRLDYDSAPGKLPAFVTPDPRDGEKHAAIIWLTGGDTNSLDDFWSPKPEANDQTARPFRDAGIVMMFPTLRGGNANPGRKEFMLGEVDDVLAAADALAKLSYVDPARIHLGGHSTGGTLALLVAESSGRFAAVFALGPVATARDYPYDMFRHPLARLEPEHDLRSPIYWLAGITSPTYVIEGAEAPGNLDSLKEICKESTNPQVTCIPVSGANHFSAISRVTKVIAARLAVPKEGAKWIIRPEDFR